MREFASQLRRLVDRSGLSIASVADRTGYSKTSWERYLNGRLLAPKGAIVALAEVTGTNPMHLTTMWELAERAWSRSEMRHDMTMEAIRISQARAALGEFGAPPATGRQTRRGGGTTARPGVAGPAGVSPTIPPQPSAPETADASPYGASSAGTPAYGAPAYGASAHGGAAHGGAAYGASAHQADAGHQSRSRGGAGGAGAAVDGSAYAGGRGAAAAPSDPSGPAGRPASAGPSAGSGPPGGGRGRRAVMFLTGAVSALAVIAAAVFFIAPDHDKDKRTEGTPGKPAPTASRNPDLPAGVKCSGEGCTGKDPETMGCGGELATTSTSATVGGALVEVRYSRTCAAAWARITRAAPGDTVSVSAGSGAAGRTGTVGTNGDTDAYTPMVTVKDATDAKACATLATGRKGCTK
ncbi:XRE family transcriptional regulator [Streptomyces sp. NPDC059786]|uniref:XRE family transcriptional regulator n=1 Tax=Streptomyces sp. NPDC059786 TaxID=3346946 RepID=UPI00365AE82A